MAKLQTSIQINAPVEKVWHTMLDDATYREWTSAFSPGSHFVGDWNTGSRIQFLGPDPTTGEIGGMTSEIAENREYEFVSIHHLGIVGKGVEDTTSDFAKQWQGYENYTFTKVDNGTELSVEMDVPVDSLEEFKNMWDKGLQKLKEVAEK